VGEDTAVLPVVPGGERDAAEAAADGGSWAAPALLGALLTGMVVVDLLLGGLALSRPLLGNSAFDGERFYGLGNGYFAYALAGLFLVVTFRLPGWCCGAAAGPGSASCWWWSGPWWSPRPSPLAWASRRAR
jgi:hypothetical protein